MTRPRRDCWVCGKTFSISPDLSDLRESDGTIKIPDDLGPMDPVAISQINGPLYRCPDCYEDYD